MKFKGEHQDQELQKDEAEVNKFRVPEDTLGLHVLYEPTKDTEVIADVVAVHGLGGDSFSMWTDKDTGKLWLKDFLPQSEYFKQTRIMTFGYDARAWLTPVNSRFTGRTFTFAEDLLAALRSRRILTETQGRPIMFIGHSLGGIVIKKALLHAHDSHDESSSSGGLFWDIYQSAKAFAFFGTPHQGADIAVWTGYLEAISKIVGISRTKNLKELETWSPSLRELSTLCSSHLANREINSFYEKFPLDKILVVSETSATLAYPHEVVVGLDANHRTMCKFGSMQSSAYHSVVQCLETSLHEIRAASVSQSIMNALPNPPNAAPVTESIPERTLEQRFSALKA